MIRVKLSELLNAYGALRQLMQLQVTADLAFRFSDAWRQIEPALINYDQRLKELRERHAVEEGARIEETPAAFQDELEKLRAVAVPLHIEPIPRSALNGQSVQAQVVIATTFLWERPEAVDLLTGDEEENEITTE